MTSESVPMFQWSNIIDVTQKSSIQWLPCLDNLVAGSLCFGKLYQQLFYLTIWFVLKFTGGFNFCKAIRILNMLRCIYISCSAPYLLWNVSFSSCATSFVSFFLFMVVESLRPCGLCRCRWNVKRTKKMWTSIWRCLDPVYYVYLCSAQPLLQLPT